MSHSRGPSKVDPITSEILRGAFVAFMDKMKINLMRTAYNMIIYEALDFTAGMSASNAPVISGAPTNAA